MATAGRLTATTTLQNAQAGAANGTAMDISNAEDVLVEITGIFTNITSNFEASIDAGTTWHIVSLAQLSATTATRLAAAIAPGLYYLERTKGMNRFRARTTAAAPTGSMTVKAVAGLW